MRRPGPTTRLLASVYLFAAATAASAATPQQLYAACATCHGSRGEGTPSLGAPAIAGQQPAYLRRQLDSFRSGVRGTHPADVYGAQMRAASASTLRDDASLTMLVKHVASLPPTTVKPTTKFDARNGNNLYQGKCGACHGGRAEGNEMLAAPRLAGLDTAYLVRQLKNFREGVRGTHPHDKYGRQMSLMAPLVVAEHDIADVVGYIQTAGNTR
jgi:cytochrome c553